MKHFIPCIFLILESQAFAKSAYVRISQSASDYTSHYSSGTTSNASTAPVSPSGKAVLKAFQRAQSECVDTYKGTVVSSACLVSLETDTNDFDDGMSYTTYYTANAIVELNCYAAKANVPWLKWHFWATNKEESLENCLEIPNEVKLTNNVTS